MVAEEAIVVRNARKSYGKGSPILDGFDMTVSRGTIYGLLGASGCGKTTLLSCIVGVKKLDGGKVWVLGGKPGSQGSGIPGPRVGYMPQEISLVKEFTVIGALYYFGRINGLDDGAIEERYGFLSELLQLPPKNRMVKHMSGGQKRRVSFAAALVHKPELLILDEPTVGLDPILRENIWQFLVKTAQEEGTTVVITTHYIEETRTANKIGLLRSGKLLAESSPGELLARFRCDTLEEAFLILSQRQKERQDGGQVESVTELTTELEEIVDTSGTDQGVTRNGLGEFETKSEKLILRRNEKEGKERVHVMRRRRFRALMTKNAIQFLQNPGGILFSLVFPLIQVILFFNAIGRDPKGLVIGVVNQEAGDCNHGVHVGNVIYDPGNDTCDYVDLSCKFLHGFEESVATATFFSDLEEASHAVRTGKVVGAMYFGKNFSKSLHHRQDNFKEASVEEVVAGEIQVWLDMGNRQIGLHVQKKLYERFFEIYEEIIVQCNIAVKFADLPIRFEEPIFGDSDQKYSTFMAPGFLLTVAFFLATSVSSSVIIADRHEGVWDRSLVQGVTTAEILTAHILTQITVIIVQVTVSLSLSFVQFQLPCKGSLTAVIILVLITGICGMCYGFLISVMCTSHTMANYVSTGTFYPVLLLCGCIWPIEGMPRFLRWISISLPTTIPAISMRGLLDKGYPVNDPQVYSGFLVVSGWTVCLVVLCFLGLRSKSAS
ncbi:ABC transporter G family member 20 isoform X2 [Orussus abietinus]|nr:ABC transporter G family member 20 isoform X2 [Orussus abietinus]XP_012281430.1 ABC transporter G family member 20 isoform X2 [Orussus abietinus]